MEALEHSYPFDPTYGYTLEALLAVGAPEPQEDFKEFWAERHTRALELDPSIVLMEKCPVRRGWRAHDLVFRSTGGAGIGGWCLTPESGVVKRVVIILHGYGGREEPDWHWKWKETALLFPVARGFGRSPHPPVSSNAMWHVLHDIQDRNRYVHGACVEDVWLAVSAALQLFPEANSRVGLIGASFGGGIGALALAWDRRIARAHFSVPSFGNHPLRLKLQTIGSGAAVQAAHRRNPDAIARTLSYHDAAVAARWIHAPVHFACAQFDPMVAPPGQFAIHNAVPGEKRLFVLPAGHFEYPGMAASELALLQEIHQFFEQL